MSKIYLSRYTGQEVEGLLNKAAQAVTKIELTTLETNVDDKLTTLETNVDNKLSTIKSGTQIYKLELKILYGDSTNPNGLNRMYLYLYTLNKVEFTKHGIVDEPQDIWSTDFIDNLSKLTIVGADLCKLTRINGSIEEDVSTFKYINSVKSKEYNTPMCIHMLYVVENSIYNFSQDITDTTFYRPYCVEFTYKEV